jgi:ABC-type antimicrobial peptide transport system permease subunit
VLARSLKLISAGTILGLIIAAMSTRALQALLYSVSAFDITTFALVTLLLGAVAFAASYLPAMRATRADPMLVLGHNT